MVSQGGRAPDDGGSAAGPSGFVQLSPPQVGCLLPPNFPSAPSLVQAKKEADEKKAAEATAAPVAKGKK